MSTAPGRGKLGVGQEGPWGIAPAETSELQLCPLELNPAFNGLRVHRGGLKKFFHGKGCQVLE